MSVIAAISTPNAPGGIAVIRVSGEGAIDVAARVFRGKDPRKMEGYTCAYGCAYDGDERLDDCILTVFRAPHSYTGEDTAEFSCHGGLYVTKRILRTLLNNGAEIAQPGEFTKRAFLNGKLDLTQAEAVMDIISARGSAELKIAEGLREGAVFRKVNSCSKRLMKLLGDLAAWSDYPDEDIPYVEPEELSHELKSIREELNSLLKNYDSGKLLREGIPTVIVGKPNVGKSTIFNSLSGCERSIVTDIAGTTRDIVEESVMLGDITLRLSDTAGIHETEEIIEGIGIRIAEKALENALLVIAVFDGSCPLTADDFYLLDKLNAHRIIAVINKSDLEQRLDESIFQEKNIHTVFISAKNSSGLTELRYAVEEMFSLNEECFSTATAANERQKNCIVSALDSVTEAINALDRGEMLDGVNVLLDEAEQSLLELTGERVTNAVVDEVFSRFCVGK